MLRSIATFIFKTLSIFKKWITPTSRSETIGIFSEECRGDNSPLVFSILEVGIGEEEEHFGELMLLEVVREELHRVAPQTGHVEIVHLVVLLRMATQSRNLVDHEI